jgi:diacylglycerol O-acyltransferase
MTTDRLSSLDIAFLCLESPATPMHMGVVTTFEPDGPVDVLRLATLIAQRAARIPRLRRRARFNRSIVGGAQWVDQPGFHANNHIDVHRLDASPADDPLADHASEWIATPLDPGAPLWAAQIVTALADNRFALLLKLHHAITDGTGAVEIGLGLLDTVSRATLSAPRTPPARSASLVSQLTDAAAIATAVARATRPFPGPATLTPNSPKRRVGFTRLDLNDIRRVRKQHGGTTNDVVLAILAGALRGWLTNRGTDPQPLRALIPVSLRGRQATQAGGNLLSGYLCELPTDIDDPIQRMHRVRQHMQRNKHDRPTRGAGALPVLANHLPPAVHQLAARFAGRAAPMLFDTVITNVPLPGIPSPWPAPASTRSTPSCRSPHTTSSESPSPPTATTSTSGCKPTARPSTTSDHSPTPSPNPWPNSPTRSCRRVTEWRGSRSV